MSVFTQQSTAFRDLRVTSTLAQPLPRLTEPFKHGEQDEKYEVFVSGAGPAGMFLTLLLARYGLKDESLLCIDSKPATLKTGQADGLSARTLEVLKTLDLADEIMNHGFHVCESTYWSHDQSTESNTHAEGIKRTRLVPMVLSPSRSPQLVTIHQGRIERILEEDLLKYSKRGIERSSRLVDVKIDDDGDLDFPVVAEIEHEGTRRKIRTKHLIGADGAHSVVRRSMGVEMSGDTTDHIWGVVDFIVDTDFPDIRRHCWIFSAAGNLMVIPRERTATGEYLTRLYIDISEAISKDVDQTKTSELTDQIAQSVGKEIKERRSTMTLENILQQAAEVFKPYCIRPKQGTEVEWWAAYQIGQRVAGQFIQKDSKGIPRVFIAGDACHTHSPKQGQGMNVSMMDSYDLSWKLIHSLNGLAASPSDLLETYHTDRYRNALRLIGFDKRLYAEVWARKGGPDLDSNYPLPTQEQVMSERAGFLSGCGIEYDEGLLVDSKSDSDSSPITGTNYLSGVIRPGRRLLSVLISRFADGCPRHLQDDLLSNGRFRLLALASTDLLDPSGRSASALSSICTRIIPQFPSGVAELIVLHPLPAHSFEWTAIPACVKQMAEMRFYNADASVYATYGADITLGASVVVRPDGYVGCVAELGDVKKLDAYLRRCLRVVKESEMWEDDPTEDQEFDEPTGSISAEESSESSGSDSEDSLGPGPG